MQLALDGIYNLKLIQQCRLWLQVVTLADICDPVGTKIEKWAFGERGRNSNLHWIRQGDPSPAAWSKWKKLL